MRKSTARSGVILVVLLIALAPLANRAAEAGGPPIQGFTVDWKVCYDGAGPTSLTTCGVGSSATSVPAGSTITTYQVITHEKGNRASECRSPRAYGSAACGRTLAAVYTPGDWSLPSAAPGALFQMQLDVGCDGVTDILASGTQFAPVFLQPWPDPAEWIPFSLTVAPPPGFIASFKPTPSTFTTHHYESFDTNLVWLAHTLNFGTIAPAIGLTENSPYQAGLDVTHWWLGDPEGDIGAPGTQCIEGVENTVIESRIDTPVTPGLYPRWALMTSSPDLKSGSVTRVLDLQCMDVGASGLFDGDGDCIDNTSDPAPGSRDADGDLVPDGVELATGTNISAPDSDLDGATDFAELFTFTHPTSAGAVACAGAGAGNTSDEDTDCDGHLDPQDINPSTAPTAAADNCPAHFNPAQRNTDSDLVYNGVPATNTDATIATQDIYGDECDTDLDNDGVANAAEVNPRFPFGICATSTPLDPFKWDVDAGDLHPDGRECKFNVTDPLVVDLYPAASPDADGDGVSNGFYETFFRTQSITGIGPVQIQDPDGGGGATATGDTDPDSDNDTLTDGAEIKIYGSNPIDPDTDSDGCNDAKELATVNGDRTVNSLDLLIVAQAFGAYNPGVIPIRVAYDFNRDRVINSIDLSQVAQRFGPCPALTTLSITNVSQ